MTDNREILFEAIENSANELDAKYDQVESLRAKLEVATREYEDAKNNLKICLLKLDEQDYEEVDEKLSRRAAYVLSDIKILGKDMIMPDDTPLEYTALRGRCCNMLKRVGVYTVGGLVEYAEHPTSGGYLYNIRGIGPDTFNRIIKFLTKHTNCKNVQEQILYKQQYHR
ncbi:MAG: hypothetical protein Q4E47_01635 [Candidatus Saccharibacteria bacterium]|nr:hypothetical protein [Candidatus Saccharibacteria bacterium]